MTTITTKTEQIKQAFRRDIETGKLAGGAPMPPERTLMTVYQVSRTTIRAALKELESEGIVSRIQGSGNFIATTSAKTETKKTAGNEQFKVGFILRTSRHSNPLFQTMFNVFESAAAPLIKPVCFFHNFIKPEIYRSEKLKLLFVDGGFDDHTMVHLEQTIAPIVVINREVKRLNFITPDHFAGGYMMVETLAKRGHRRILCVVEQDISDLPPNDEMALRQNGIMKAAAKFDIELALHALPHTDAATMLSQIADHWIRQKQKASAIITTRPMTALRLYDVLEDKRISVPDDISVIGYDEMYYTSSLRPPLSVISQPFEQIAQYLLYAAKAAAGEKTWRLRKKLAPILIDKGSISKNIAAASSTLP